MSIEQRTDGSDWLDYAVTPEEHERRRKHFEAIALQQQSNEVDTSGEAVAEVVDFAEGQSILNWNKHWSDFPIGTKFYTHPPKPVVSDEMVERVMMIAFTEDDARAALEAALSWSQNSDTVGVKS